VTHVDVTEQINSVQRQVGSRTLAAGEAKVVTVTRSYRAEPAEVWDAFTDQERLGRWFLPISGELKVGGHYQFEGNAGGTIERCEPPREFDVTWEYAGDVSWVQVRLQAEPDGRTRLELEHVAHVDDERWDEFGPGAVGLGWEMGFLGLTWFLEAGGHDGPEAGMAWAGSDEGRDYLTRSSELWAAASIEAGTDVEAARAAGARTTAAYTGG
jgi:uncharacterized protein YndB with AHSA1/START domain